MSGNCCDMRGFLAFQIMLLLSKKSMYGRQLAEEIGKRRGEKPKAGTIYPALKSLKSKGFIKGTRKGKTIVYSLTPSGRSAVNKARAYFCRAFRDVLDD